MSIGPPFSAQINHQNGSVIVRVSGELDLASAPRLQATAAHLICGSVAGVTIDLSGLEFADLTGLRALDDVGHDVSRAGAEFHVIGVTEYLRRIIRVAEFADLERACRTTT